MTRPGNDGSSKSSRSERPFVAASLEIAKTLGDQLPKMAEFRRFLLGSGLLIASLVIGCLFYMGHGWSFSDAAYMVVISVTTVGYEEVRPIDTIGLRLTTTFVLLLGLVGNAVLIAAIAEILISRSLSLALGRTNLGNRIASLKGHVIIVGYGNMGQETARRLLHGGLDLVIIDNSPEATGLTKQADFPFVQGDGMSEAVLIEAGIERASYILCLLGNDVDNVFVTLSARQLNPLIRIVTKAEQQSSSRKLYQAGANHVISPFSMGSIRISHLLLNPALVELSDAISVSEGESQVQIYEISAERVPKIVGMTFKEFHGVFNDIKAVVLGIRHGSGSVSFPPPMEHKINEYESLILLIRSSDVAGCETAMNERVAKPQTGDVVEEQAS